MRGTYVIADIFDIFYFYVKLMKLQDNQKNSEVRPGTHKRKAFWYNIFESSEQRL